MNYALILAGGIGQRIQSPDLPKQFFEVNSKPLILYTIEKFVKSNAIHKIIVACNSLYIDYLKNLLIQSYYSKPIEVIAGGDNRQSSVQNGVDWIEENGGVSDDLVVIHDGVRPLVDLKTIEENVELAGRCGAAMTVHPVTETVVVTSKESAAFDDFKRRDETFSLTSPQTFKMSVLLKLYRHFKVICDAPMPLLDPALVYSYLGEKIPLVKEHNNNLKITTPEDYYIFKALLEYEEKLNG